VLSVDGFAELTSAQTGSGKAAKAKTTIRPLKLLWVFNRNRFI
jgi:hypothetical protein